MKNTKRNESYININEHYSEEISSTIYIDSKYNACSR